MTKIRFRYDARCPRHPRYKPETQGQAAIRGGCPICTQLYMVAKTARDLDREIRYMQQTLDEHAAREKVPA